MFKTTATTLTLCAILALSAAPALADHHTGRGWSVGAGIGFLADREDAFLISLEAPYRFSGSDVVGRLSLGPMVQFGLDEDFFTMFWSANGRLHATAAEIVNSREEWARNLSFFGQAGLGVSYVEIDVPGTPDDAAFLINFGWGFDYALTDRVTLTSNMLFNFHAGELFNDSFTFTWNMIGARYAF